MNRETPSRTARGARVGIGMAAACVAVLLGATAADAEQTIAPARPWSVIVHPANPMRSMPHEELERVYRRRSRFWPDGSTILPLNLPGSDPLRRAFSAEVLHSEEEELTTYWNRQYFQGVAPPAVLQSSKAVHAYVAATPGAIGYVESGDIDASVAVVEVTNGR